MKKTLNEDAIKNELSGKSAFFPDKKNHLSKSEGARDDFEPTQDRENSSRPETAVPRYDIEILEEVRKALRFFGKEAATHRFTSEEKQALIDIIYHFNKLGIRTSENEITRIALNFILQDFEENKNVSILTRIIEMLND